MGTKLPETFELTIERLIPGGEGLGHYNGRPVYVFGVTPGDCVRVRPVKVNQHNTKASVVDIINPSADRRTAREEHFLSCSPYQIISEEKQLEYKKTLIQEVFRDKCGELSSPPLEITAGEKPWNYRNKIEFSFTTTQDDQLTLAFFQRFRFNHYFFVDGCAIAHEKINLCAEKILEVLRERKVSSGQLKNIVVRYSYAEDACLAVLYVMDEHFPVFDVDIDHLNGWLIVYSNPLSPAARTIKILHRQGRDYLIEKAGGLMFKYFYDSFFQINPPVFEKVLEYIREQIRRGRVLVDLYSGVGTIGFNLAGQFEKVFSVESDEKALVAAGENRQNHQLENVTIMSGLAEKADLRIILAAADTLIVDPPRSGLHPKVTKTILEACPECFIYVSCNPLTQASDLAVLKEKYQIRGWRLFDLYPQTPHVECVAVLQRK